jgi:hypothetical protein
MFTRSVSALILIGLVAAPGIAGAQMASPKPMASHSAMMTKKSTTMSNSEHHTAAMHSAMSKSKMSGANSAQSDHPGAPNYSGSSPLGSAQKSPEPK